MRLHGLLLRSWHESPATRRFAIDSAGPHAPAGRAGVVPSVSSQHGHEGVVHRRRRVLALLVHLRGPVQRRAGPLRQPIRLLRLRGLGHLGGRQRGPYVRIHAAGGLVRKPGSVATPTVAPACLAVASAVASAVACVATSATTATSTDTASRLAASAASAASPAAVAAATAFEARALAATTAITKRAGALSTAATIAKSARADTTTPDAAASACASSR